MYVGNMYVMVDKLETGVPNEQSWVGPYGNFTKVGIFEFRMAGQNVEVLLK